MALPQKLSLEQTQTTWAAQIQPVLNKPWNSGILLENVVLASGANVVSHRLGRKLVGWIPTRVRADATLFDTQDTNPTPGLTLQLTSSAAVTVDLIVF